MLEAEGVLKTWALPAWPSLTVEMECRMLPDHRLAYLEYEGEVSGGRGNVRRVEAGEYSVERRSANEWVVAITGRKLVGRVELRQTGETPSCWCFLGRTGPT